MQSLYKVGNLINLHRNQALPIFRRCCSKLYEPAYLESMKSKIPLYDTLNIQIKGYDFPILESYQKYIHSMLKNLDIAVEECWASPAQKSQVLRYKEKSSIVDSEYVLNIYERNVQIVDISSTQYPILIQLLEASLPEGVTLNIHEHDDSMEEVRYVPDKELLQLKSQLDDMTTPTTKKK